MAYLNPTDKATIQKLTPAIEQMNPVDANALSTWMNELVEAHKLADSLYDLLKRRMDGDPEKAIEEYCAPLSPTNRAELEAFLFKMFQLSDAIYGECIRFTLATAVCEKLDTIAVDVWNDAQAEKVEEEQSCS